MHLRYATAFATIFLAFIFVRGCFFFIFNVFTPQKSLNHCFVGKREAKRHDLESSRNHRLGLSSQLYNVRVREKEGPQTLVAASLHLSFLPLFALRHVLTRVRLVASPSLESIYVVFALAVT